MNKNMKFIFFTVTLLVLIVGLGAISAVDVTDNSSVADTHVSTQVTHENTDTVSAGVNKANSADNSVSDVKNVKSKANNKVTTKSVKSGVNSTKSLKSSTYTVNSENFGEYFNLTHGGSLTDKVNSGDTLDIQGKIILNRSISLNKPVNLISSTHDAYIDCNTTAGDYFGSNPGSRFAIYNGGSYSNVTGIYFHNTQLWLANTHHVTLDNISAVVENQRIGSGVGQTSIRENSSYITVKNSYIYTENNGGSSSLVLAYAYNCRLENNTVRGVGEVGNLIYATTYNVNIPNGTIGNYNNTIIGNKIYGPAKANGICYGICLSGVNNTVDSNYIYYKNGFGIMYQWGSGITGDYDETNKVARNNNTIINNVLDGGCGINAGDYIYNNVLINYGSGNGRIYVSDAYAVNNTANVIEVGNTAYVTNNTVNNITCNVNTKKDKIVSNNTIKNVRLTNKAGYVYFTNNTITGTVSTNGTFCNFTNNTVITGNQYTFEGRGTNNNITGNYLVAGVTVGDATINLVQKNRNTILNNSPEEGTVYNITDKTYSNYFNNEGYLTNPIITNYSAIQLIGDFKNKSFIFNNSRIAVSGLNARVYDGYLKITGSSLLSVKNITFVNDENINSSIILDTSYNRIQDNNIIHKTNNKTPVIEINTDNNFIERNNITSTGNSTVIDISSNDNQILNNHINTTGNNNPVTIINIDRNTENNILTNNAITATNKANITVIKLEDTILNMINNNKMNITSENIIKAVESVNSNNNTIRSNTFNLTSDDTVYGIQFNSNNNTQITRNTVNSNYFYINTDNTAYGIQFNPDNNSPITENTITWNQMYVNATNIALIELNGQNNTVKNTINGLRIYANTTRGIAVKVSGDNNTITGTISVHSKDKDNTTALLLNNTHNTYINRGTYNITNGTGIKLVNAENTTIYWAIINANENTPITLYNSDNNNITRTVILTQQNKTIDLNQSDNNTIDDNYLNCHYITGGDITVKTDTQTNTIQNNKPVIGTLTHETCKELFNENGLYIGPEYDVLVLADDFNGTDFIFDKKINMTNLGQHTLYNSTIIITGNTTNTTGYRFYGINFNNTDKPVFINNVTKTDKNWFYVMFNDLNITMTGDNLTAFDLRKLDSLIGFQAENDNINMTGKNTTVLIRDDNLYWTTRGYNIITRCNITLHAEDTAMVYNINNSRFQLRSCNVTINAKNAIATIARNSTINDIFLGYAYNTIKETGDNVSVLLYEYMPGSTSYNIRSNNITLTSKNPITAFKINNVTKTYLVGNIIIADSYNNGTPVIIVENSTRATVKDNYIEAHDIAGNDAIQHDAQVTLTNNTPNNNTGYKNNIRIEINNNPTINRESNIQVTVTDVFGNPVNGTITINIDNTTTTLTETNTTVKYTPKTSGEHTITVTYTDSTGKYLNNTHNTTIKLPKLNTTLQIADITTVLDDLVTFTATITDSNGDNVTSGQVVFLVNGTELTDKNGNIIYADVTDGVAALNYTVPYSWLNVNDTGVAYIGNDVYESSDNTGNITVNRKTVNMKVEVLNNKIRPGETAIIMVTVTDKYGNMVKSGKVVFKLNGKTIKDANGSTITVRIHNGIAIFKYVVPAGYSAKNYTLTAVSVGNTYNRVEASTNITLTKINTYIQNVNTYFTGNTLHVKANIISSTTQKNTAYRETKVSIKINNKTFAKEVKITNGSIDLNIDTSSIGRGNYKITIKAGENGIYTGSQLDTYTYKQAVKSALNQTNSNGTLVKA